MQFLSHFQVSYIPTEEGDHEVDLRLDGTPLPDSPFPVTAIRGCNPQKVKAYGDGLERGICDEPNAFTIETRNAGTGGLGIAVEGPSEAEMNCTDNKDGTCTVEYVPVEEGDYDIAIKFDDEHIPGEICWNNQIKRQRTISYIFFSSNCRIAVPSTCYN